MAGGLAPFVAPELTPARVAEVVGSHRVNEHGAWCGGTTGADIEAVLRAAFRIAVAAFIKSDKTRKDTTDADEEEENDGIRPTLREHHIEAAARLMHLH
eukprot:SAG31_NODE_653_length_13152_cov_4.899487_11_plen_99_part_00